MKNNKETRRRAVLSFIMAIILWSIVMGVVNPIMSVTFRQVPVEFTNKDSLKNDLKIVSQDFQRVNVEVRGTKSALRNLRTENIYAHVDLSKMEVGENRAEVLTSIRGSASEVEIVNVDPAFISIQIDEESSVSRNIALEVKGNLPDGYSIGEVRAVNKTVKISGVKSKLEKIEGVVGVIDVSNLTNTDVRTVALQFLDADGNEVLNINPEFRSVEVEIPVFRIKSVPIRVKTTGSLPDGTEIENIAPDPANVILRGEADVINKINSVDTKPINIENLLEDSNINIELIIPEGAEIYENVNITINYDVKEPGAIELVIPVSDIELRNKNEDYNYEFVGIENAKAVAVLENDEINTDNITKFVDVSNLPIGTHNVKLNFVEHEGVKISAVRPNQLVMKVTQKPQNITDDEDENSKKENPNQSQHDNPNDKPNNQEEKPVEITN